MAWGARAMPEIRDQLAMVMRRLARDRDQVEADSLATGALGGLPPEAEVRAEAQAMAGTRDLYWVVPQMARLALAASHDLPSWTPAAARPSETGLLIWDGGLPPVMWLHAPPEAWRKNAFGALAPPKVPLDGVWWRAAPDGKFYVNLLTRSRNLGDADVPHWQRTELYTVQSMDANLYGDGSAATSRSPDPAGIERVDDAVMAALGATWLLMNQPTVATQTEMPQPSGKGTGKAKGARPADMVRVVDLRKIERPREDDPIIKPSREWKHQWMVRAHWRQQACGPGRQFRKPMWIAPYTKGPEGAPLLESEHVMVWRR